MGKGAGKGSSSSEDDVLAMEAHSLPCLPLKRSLGALKRSFNFCAGPAMLDSEAMLSMSTEFLSWQGSGVSLIEMSQRDKGGPVQTMVSEAVLNIRRLLKVPHNYKILLFQGGAHGQFAAVPLNLCGKVKRAQYVDGGFWSQRAMREGTKYLEHVGTAASVYKCPKTGLLRYPSVDKWALDADSAYVHIVSNETIQGVELGDPDVGDMVLAADMTSTLLSRPVDVSKYGVIYASGGKNLGPAGVCVVIVRDDLLDQEMNMVPSVLSWKVMDDHDNLYNTQCTFAIWAMKTVTDRLLAQGGLGVIQQRVDSRAAQFYAVLDSSDGFYTNLVHPDYRSRTSVPFRILGGRTDLEADFIHDAQRAGLHQLAGHHSVGGLRVCIYNGIPDDALHALVCFMERFMEGYQMQRMKR